MLNKVKDIKALKASVMVVALVLMALAVFGIYVSNSSADSIYESGVNENGMTYGSAMNASTPEEEPDLIQVEATNGAIGYVYKTQLSIAEGDNVSNPDEAVAYMRCKDENRVSAFNAYINEHINANINVDFEHFKKARASFMENNEDVEIVCDFLGIDSSLESLDAELMRNAFAFAEKSNAKSIDVYEKDGVTKIGVFVVE